MLIGCEKNKFIGIFNHAFLKNEFVRLSLSKIYKAPNELKNLYAVTVQIKSEKKISLTYRYKSKDEVKNFSIEKTLLLLQDILGVFFLQAQLNTLTHSYQLLFTKKGKSSMISTKSKHVIPLISHNKEKNYLIKSKNNKYLQLLGICDEKGRIKDKHYHKFKQINRYIELIAPLFNKLDIQEEFKIIDMGAGKGYLTFALYDYLKNILKKNVSIIGVELKKELVSLCMNIKEVCGFDNLKFIFKNIEDFNNDEIDVMIALHACDTATDQAIYKGIKAQAKLIVCAPCCHKQVRIDMNSNSQFKSITKHGIFEDRQAEIITDSLRALLMEKEGYQTKVFEFISNKHTRKNIMLVGKKRIRKKNKKEIQKEIQKEIDFLKNSFQIKRQELEDLLNQS